MKLEYPIIVKKDKSDYLVHVPDLQIDTFGKSLNEAIDMAYDAIGMTYVTREDNKLKIKKPSKINKISNMKKYKNDIVTIVSIDPIIFREINDNKSVRRNITLPNWLDKIARKQKINISEFLQNSLKEKFNIRYA